jgi:lipopolysaccharide export system permease protein
MKILVRYLFLNLLQPLLYLLLLFTLLFIIADLMSNAGEFLKTGASPLMMAQYYSLQLPSLVIFIVPICLLLSTLYSLSALTRHSEITAMRATGVSIYRIIRPYLFLGFVCFLLTALVNEYTGPKYAYRAHQLLKSQMDESEDVYFEQIPYKNPTVGHSWYIESFDTRNYTMLGVTLRKLRPDGSDKTKYTAAKGMWMDGRWWFQDGTVQHFDKNNNLDGVAETFQIREMHDLPEIPEDFMGEAKDTAHQSSLELWKYIQTHQFLSHSTIISKKVDFHHKLTMPFICLIATLIGIPVGAHTGRKGAFAGTMLAIGMFFGFYALQFSMEYMAKQMYVLPWIGAWSAIIVFFVIGFSMIHRMR